MPTESNQAFFEAYQEKWDREPDYHSAGNFVAEQVLRKAVEGEGD
jgi:ABC-type branched-subunit amino acid transport system substrate-binding protein